MRIEHIGFVVLAALAALSIGCDTCKERCDFAADYYDSCLSEWNSTWEELGIPYRELDSLGQGDEGATWVMDSEHPYVRSKSEFKRQCNDSVKVGRAQVTDCCASEEEDPDLTAEQLEEKQEECENNTLLAIDRNCEDNKELYRQPCSQYWQEVYQHGGADFPEDNPTCQDLDEEDAGDDDSAS